MTAQFFAYLRRQVGRLWRIFAKVTERGGQMADQESWVGGRVSVSDSRDTYPTDGEAVAPFRGDQIRLDDAATEDYHAVRKSEIETEINNVLTVFGGKQTYNGFQSGAPTINQDTLVNIVNLTNLAAGGFIMPRDGSVISIALQYEVTGASANTVNFGLCIDANDELALARPIAVNATATYLRTYFAQDAGVTEFSANDMICPVIRMEDGISDALTITNMWWSFEVQFTG